MFHPTDESTTSCVDAMTLVDPQKLVLGCSNRTAECIAAYKSMDMSSTGTSSGVVNEKAPKDWFGQFIDLLKRKIKWDEAIVGGISGTDIEYRWCAQCTEGDDDTTNAWDVNVEKTSGSGTLIFIIPLLRFFFFLVMFFVSCFL